MNNKELEILIEKMNELKNTVIENLEATVQLTDQNFGNAKLALSHIEKLYKDVRQDENYKQFNSTKSIIQNHINDLNSNIIRDLDVFLESSSQYKREKNNNNDEKIILQYFQEIKKLENHRKIRVDMNHNSTEYKIIYGKLPEENRKKYREVYNIIKDIIDEHSHYREDKFLDRLILKSDVKKIHNIIEESFPQLESVTLSSKEDNFYLMLDFIKKEDVKKKAKLIKYFLLRSKEIDFSDEIPEKREKIEKAISFISEIYQRIEQKSDLQNKLNKIMSETEKQEKIITEKLKVTTLIVQKDELYKPIKPFILNKINSESNDKNKKNSKTGTFGIVKNSV